jgi:hypothetical protein
MPMKMRAAGATAIQKPSDMTGSKRPALLELPHSPALNELPPGYEFTADEDLPYWEKTRLGLLPPTCSAPLNPLNDKRRGVRTATTGSAPVYNISLTITGDVSAPLSLLSDGNMPL